MASDAPASAARHGASTRRSPANAYLRVVSVDVAQPYYSGALCRDVAIEPTAATKARLAWFGFLWRPRAGGGDIVASTALTTAFGQFMKALEEDPAAAARAERAARLFGEPLMFAVRVAQPGFLNATALPWAFGTGETTLCLSNRTSEAAAGDPEGEDRATIAPEWRKAVPLRSAVERGDPPKDAKSVAERAESAREFRPTEWWETPEASRFLAEAVEQAARSPARRLPFALLELYIAPPADDRGAARNALFPVHLSTRGSCHPGELAGGYLHPVRYTVALPVRSTRWRYIVALRGERIDPDDLEIGDSGKRKTAFEREDAEDRYAVPGARRTAVFLSAEPIALEERPKARFYLKHRGRDGARSERRLVDPLPAPGPDCLPFHCSAAGADVSEIYVFV